MNKKNLFVVIVVLISLNIVLAEEIIPLENQDLNTTSEVIQIEEISLKNLIPQEFKLGDAQFSIQIQNNKNESISNVMAFVSGKGFSTYDVTPIEVLEGGEKGYILINGNFKESGLIPLTIKINQNTFDYNITVLGESQEDLKKAEQLAKQEEENKKVLGDLNLQLEDLKQNYTALEAQLAKKGDEGYDTKGVSLGDLKNYIRDAQASILGGHIEGARVNLGLAEEEYNSLVNKIANLPKLSKVTRFKEYAIIFSSIAGAIITFFALYELLKKKGTTVATSIENIKQKTEKPKKEES